MSSSSKFTRSPPSLKWPDFETHYIFPSDYTWLSSSIYPPFDPASHNVNYLLNEQEPFYAYDHLTKPDEVKRFKGYWTAFIKRMATYSKRPYTFECVGRSACGTDHKGFSDVAPVWSPLARVIERGREGDRYHVHAIFSEFFLHSYAVHVWRAITGEKSNVNFRSRGSRSLFAAVSYLAKYIHKDDSPRYMGDFIRR